LFVCWQKLAHAYYIAEKGLVSVEPKPILPLIMEAIAMPSKWIGCLDDEQLTLPDTHRRSSP